MTVGQWILVSLVGLGVGYWLVNALLMLRTIRCVPLLENLRPPQPENWPRLSLIIPACNEVETIEAATESRLSDGYPNLEVVLIDDRSDDGTSEIIDRLAAADDRVRALHITERPAGWIGKVHALHRGVEAATGQWLLFTDADVHIQPGTLARTVGYCIETDLDHLAVIPRFWQASFILGCMLASFLRIICLSARAWAVKDPESSASIGVGAFNLVRRSAFERTGGFEELKMTVVDDVALGQMMKRSGARCSVVNGRRHLGLHFYRTLAEAAGGTEKSALVAFRFSYLSLAVVMLVMLWCEISPIVALLLGWGMHGSGDVALTLLVLGTSGMVLALLTALLTARWAAMRLLPAACFPLGLLLCLVIVARAAVLAAWRGGHTWRGVLYTNEELRAGNRLKFP